MLMSNPITSNYRFFGVEVVPHHIVLAFLKMAI